MAKQKRKYTTITIPNALFDNISRNIKNTGFSSVSDYATYVLRETITELQLGKLGKSNKNAITEKLKALGYIQ